MNRFRILSWIALATSALGLSCVSSYPPSGPYEPDYRYSHPYYPPDNRGYGYSNERFAALAHELDDRAARAHEIAETRAGSLGSREQEFFARIHHFSDQARAFHERYESGKINSRGRLREEINHLRDDARAEQEKAISMVRALFAHYLDHPDEIPPEYDHAPGDTPTRIADYIAGMTDRYCLRVYEQLFLPQGWLL